MRSKYTNQLPDIALAGLFSRETSEGVNAMNEQQ